MKKCIICKNPIAESDLHRKYCSNKCYRIKQKRDYIPVEHNKYCNLNKDHIDECYPRRKNKH